MTTIASAHSPVITGPRVEQAFDMLGRLADAEPPPCPDQAVLEAMLTAMGGEASDAGGRAARIGD